MNDKIVILRRIGIFIGIILLCASFFTFLCMHWKLSFAFMLGACVLGVVCGDDDDF